MKHRIRKRSRKNKPRHAVKMYLKVRRYYPRTLSSSSFPPWEPEISHILLLTYVEYIGRAIAQAVNRLFLTEEDGVRALVSPCGICSGQSGSRTGFSQSSSVCPISIISPRFSILIYITRGMNNRPVGGRSSETSSHPIDMNNKKDMKLWIRFNWSRAEYGEWLLWVR
jgi:hypothetical protein